MDERYSQIRENLRQQHSNNTAEIHGKKVDNFSKYGYYGNDSFDEANNFSFSFKTKFFLFFVSVMLFSFYIYGEQDVEKGARKAWSEMKIQIIELENEDPTVKEAMGYVRKAYDEVEDFTKTYMNIGN